MREELLSKLENIERSYGEAINGGALQEELTALVKAVQKELGVEIPPEVLQALGEINGFECNGVIFYGVDEKLLAKKPVIHINGLIETNLEWYENEWQKKYLFVGHRDISWYVFNLVDKRYYELDLPSGNVVTKFATFDEVLTEMLTDAIDE